MSADANSPPERAGAPGGGAEWDRLELSARRLLQEHADFRRRARRAEARVGELEGALREVAHGTIDPVDLQKRLQNAERENTELRRRLSEARERVRRIIARLRFLDESR